MEVWKQIKTHPSYHVSNLGRVRAVEGTTRTGILKPSIVKGYPMVSLGKESYAVHRLVAFAFVHNPDPDNLTVVNHIDEVKHHNFYFNLEWTTQQLNVEHSLCKLHVYLRAPSGAKLLCTNLTRFERENGIGRKSISRLINREYNEIKGWKLWL